MAPLEAALVSMKPSIAPFALAFILSACVTGQAPIATKPVFRAPQGRAACLEAGGQWSWPGMSRQGEPDDFQGMCVIKLPDAGAPCTSSSQCMGTCRATRGEGEAGPGVCSTTNYAAGCLALVEDGVAKPLMCAD